MMKSNLYAGRTLHGYLAATYTLHLLSFLAVLLGIIYLFDTVELIRRASRIPGIPMSVVFQMGLLKLPEVGQEIAPFAVLFAAVYSFWTLNRRSELVIIRAAGYSVWQILSPLVFTAILLGVMMTTVINPISSVLLNKFESIEDTVFGKSQNIVRMFEEGMWLRQPTQNGYTIIHAQQVSVNNWQLTEVMALLFSRDDQYIQRIDAPKAELQRGAWVFHDAVIHKPRQPGVFDPVLAIPTDLTQAELAESFEKPTTMSFWALPSYIKTVEETGFDAIGLKMYYHSLLAKPAIFAAMILLAATVSLRPPRHNRHTLQMVLLGIFMGLSFFFFTSFLQALGSSHQIAIPLAAWAPASIAAMLAIGYLLTQEDG